MKLKKKHLNTILKFYPIYYLYIYIYIYTHTYKYQTFSKKITKIHSLQNKFTKTPTIWIKDIKLKPSLKELTKGQKKEIKKKKNSNKRSYPCVTLPRKIIKSNLTKGLERKLGKKKKTNKILLSQCLYTKKNYTLENACHVEDPS